MIRASYRVEGDTHSLTVTGHAGYAEKGSDIVCAGASALVQALLGFVEEYPCEIECVSIDHSTGEVLISCRGGNDVTAVFQMTALGLEQIAFTYPDYVEIETNG